MVKAILFDFDGTLANTLPLCIKAFQHVFQSYDGRELTDHEVKMMFGPSETGIIREHLEHKDTMQAIETYYAVYKESHLEAVPEYLEIPKVLTKLKDEGYLLGIVTGKASRSLKLSLEELKLNSFFDVLISGDDVKNAKPDPEGIELAINKLTLRKEEVVYIGDSDADLMAGKEAGVKTIAAHWLPDYHPTFSVKADATLYWLDELYPLLQAKYD